MKKYLQKIGQRITDSTPQEKAYTAGLACMFFSVFSLISLLGMAGSVGASLASTIGAGLGAEGAFIVPVLSVYSGAKALDVAKDKKVKPREVFGVGIGSITLLAGMALAGLSAGVFTAVLPIVMPVYGIFGGVVTIATGANVAISTTTGVNPVKEVIRRLDIEPVSHQPKITHKPEIAEAVTEIKVEVPKVEKAKVEQVKQSPDLSHEDMEAFESFFTDRPRKNLSANLQEYKNKEEPQVAIPDGTFTLERFQSANKFSSRRARDEINNLKLNGKIVSTSDFNQFRAV
jgi:hypothetical protein